MAALAYPGAPAPPASGFAVPAVPGNLRPRLTSFVGRQAEVEALRRRLRESRLITLTGPGGSGKTRLSEETAATAAGAYPDGVWVAELAPLDDPSAVPGTVLSAVGRRDTTWLGAGFDSRTTGPDGADPTARLIEHCAHRRLLLLLDNCEHVIDAAARLAETLLAHCPGVTVLATSREPLGVPGETVRPVEPLLPAPAHQLFAERATAVRPGFAADQDRETAAAVAEICRRLDGLPLAIELAAARLRLLTPRQIADRLDDRFRLLTSGSRTVLPRQQTLRAVVDWSWDLLDERERTLLRRAAVFTGGWDLAAAEAVCADGPDTDPGTGPDTDPGTGPDTAPAGPGAAAPDDATVPGERVRIERADVLDLLGALVDKSLLVAEQPPRRSGGDEPGRAGPARAVPGHAGPGGDGPGGDGREGVDRDGRDGGGAGAGEPGTGGPGAGEPDGMRYRMLETIHEYATERAAETPGARRDHLAAIRRHTAHFRAFVRTAEPRLRSAEQLPWLRRVETELDNLRAALHRSLQAGDTDSALALVFGLGWFWWLRNYRDEGASWIDRLLGVLAPGVLPVLAREGAPAPAAGGPAGRPDPLDIADLQLLRYFLLSDERSDEELRSPPSLAVAVAIRDAYSGHTGPRSARFPGVLWPFAAYFTDGRAGVLRLLDQAVVNCREHRAEWALAVALMFRTHLVIDMPGGVRRAELHWPELRELSRRVGDRWVLAQVHGANGEMAMAHGRYAEARASYEEALRLARELGALAETPFLVTRLADLAFQTLETDEALRLLEQADAEADRYATYDARAFIRLLRAFIAVRNDDAAAARTLYEEARQASARSSPPPQADVALHGLDAWLTAAAGNLPEALRKAGGALRMGVESGCTEAVQAHQAMIAAGILLRMGEPGRAGQMLGAAKGWLGGLPPTPVQAEQIADIERKAGAALGARRYAEHHAAGMGLSALDCVALLDTVLAASGRHRATDGGSGAGPAGTGASRTDGHPH
ncbi:ATP-binding protein [Streptomyces pactum]|uniref:ATP-binding protein n=1 Tax=Streptomyces pactum TaxID=68249 RepID=UPI0027DE9F6C|nr:AAA family ATPase [Streptomyces pactum]